MEMTYWTTLKETKECVLDPYDCNLDEYDTYFEGDLKLKNVDTNGWSNDGSDNIQIYLAFDQRIVSDVEVYDILTFQYTWDSTKIKEVGRWSCVDGNIPLNLQQVGIDLPNVEVDPEQNCVVDNKNSTVSYDEETKIAGFSVRFRRALITRAIKLDSQLEIGEKVIINYGYTLNNEANAQTVTETLDDGTEVTTTTLLSDFNQNTKPSDLMITILDNSKMLMVSLSAMVFVSLSAIF